MVSDEAERARRGPVMKGWRDQECGLRQEAQVRHLHGTSSQPTRTHVNKMLVNGHCFVELLNRSKTSFRRKSFVLDMEIPGHSREAREAVW